MARKITVTKSELDALKWLAERSGLHDDSREGAKVMKVFGGLVKKAEKSHAPPAVDGEKAATISLLESTLLNAGGPKVAKMATQTAREYVLLTREIAERKMTADEVAEVGRWLRRQAWLNGRVTLNQVVRSWGTWYGRARVEKQRSTAPAMLGETEETDEGTAAAGSAE